MKAKPRSTIFVLVAFVMIFAAACGSVSTPSTSAPSETKQPVAVETKAAPVAIEATQPVQTEPPSESKQPSVLRYPISSDPSSLEPGLVKELLAGQIALSLHAGLFTFDKDTNVVPYMVKEYEVSDDKTVFTFKLYDNIVWHNGRPLVAEDFKKGWMRYLDPKVGAQSGGEPFMKIVGAKELFEGTSNDLPGVEAIDDHTLRVTLAEPSSNFITELAVPDTWVVPEEAVVAGQPQWVDKPIGAGPYKFVEWVPNVKIVLEANPDFFLGKPAIDRIEFLVVPDRATALAQYEAGELDIVAVPPAEIERVTNDPVLGKEIHYWTRAQLLYLGMNQSMFEPFKDKRVRQAFNYALDREGVIKNILHDSVQLATGLVPPNIPEYNPGLKGYEYDPEKAQALMSEAGYPSGAGFPDLTLAALPADATSAEAIAAQISANLGINIEIITPERGDLIDGLWAHDRWQFFDFGWTADRPSAAVWTYELLYSGLDSNFSTYSNPELDALVDKARAALDPEESKHYWQQAEQLAMEDAAMIPFGYSRYIFLVKPYIQGFECNLFGPLGFNQTSITQ